MKVLTADKPEYISAPSCSAFDVSPKGDKLVLKRRDLRRIDIYESGKLQPLALPPASSDKQPSFADDGDLILATGNVVEKWQMLDDGLRFVERRNLGISRFCSRGFAHGGVAAFARLKKDSIIQIMDKTSLAVRDIVAPEFTWETIQPTIQDITPDEQVVALTHSEDALLIFATANQHQIVIACEIFDTDDVVLSDDARYVAVTENSKLKIWHLDWQNLQACPTWLSSKHRSLTTCMRFSPDSKTLAIGYHSGCISLLDLAQQKLYDDKTCNGYVEGLMWFPAGDRLVYVTNSGVWIRNVLETSRCFASLPWQPISTMSEQQRS